MDAEWCEWRGLAGEAVAGLMAGDDTVGPEVAEILSQLAPRRQHRGFHVVDDSERQADALGRLSPLVSVGEGKAPGIADRSTPMQEAAGAPKSDTANRSSSNSSSRLSGRTPAIFALARQPAASSPLSPVRPRSCNPTAIASTSSRSNISGGRS